MEEKRERGKKEKVAKTRKREGKDNALRNENWKRGGFESWQFEMSDHRAFDITHLMDFDPRSTLASVNLI